MNNRAAVKRTNNLGVLDAHWRAAGGAGCSAVTDMRFPPGAVVTIYFEDRTHVSARPFFYASGARGGMQMQLVADDGVVFESVEDSPEVFQSPKTGRVAYLQPRDA